jgi:hypothetical protein
VKLPPEKFPARDDISAIKPPAGFLQNQNRNPRNILSYFTRCDDEFMGNPIGPQKDKPRKPYEKPTVTKLTPEEAKFKLIDHASRGDQGAKDMLEMMFPEETKKLSTGEKSQQDNGSGGKVGKTNGSLN